MFVSLLWPAAAKASTTAVCDTYQVNGGDEAFLMSLNTPLEFGGTVYNGNVYVSPKGTVTFGQGDYTFWDYPATPSISIASWDYHAFATGTHPWAAQNDLYVRYGSTATSICVDWKVLPWGQSSGDPVYIRLIAEVNPVNYTWTPTYQVSSTAPAGARYGVRYTQGGEVFPLTIQTISEPPAPAPVVPPAPSPSPSPTPTPEPTPEEPTPSPTPTPEPTPEEPTPSPSPTPEPSPEPSPEPTPEPTPSPVVPVEPVVPPTNPVDPTPEPSQDPEPVVQPSLQPVALAPIVQPTAEPAEPSSEPSLEPTPPVENSITSAQNLPVQLSSAQLMNVDLTQIVATDLTKEQAEALVAAALETFATAEQGSEEYNQALVALFVAAQQNDIVLDESLAAIPLLGDVLGGATELINFLGNAGADMSPAVREDSEKIVITAIVAVQAALSAISISGIATTVNIRNGA
jgi:hypothetical protein